jgi:dTDP-4-dehydrorhamnose reductase
VRRDHFSNKARPLILFGSSGQLGASILRVLPHDRIRRILWKDVASLSNDGLREMFSRSEPSDFVFANGLTDPKLPLSEIEQSNIEFPIRVIEQVNGLSSDSSHRFLTFGTIQENFPEVCRSNPYLNSKLKLYERIRHFHALPGAEFRFLHFRIHTLYGRGAKEHMFLGQMIQAIREQNTFAMSSGDQLREYHHVDDVAQSIAAVLDQDWKFGPAIELSSGNPVRLAELARAVFRAMNSESLLQIGGMTRHPAENTAKVFSRSPDWLLNHSREPIAGVLAEVRAILGKRT